MLVLNLPSHVCLHRSKALHDFGSDLLVSDFLLIHLQCKCAQCKYTGYLRSFSYYGTCLLRDGQRFWGLYAPGIPEHIT